MPVSEKKSSTVRKTEKAIVPFSLPLTSFSSRGRGETMTTRHMIEATLLPDPTDDSQDFKADIIFTYLPGAAPCFNPKDGGDPGWPAEVDILEVIPVGVIAPIDTETLRRLADEWLNKEGGYYACCHVAEQRNGGWE